MLPISLHLILIDDLPEREHTIYKFDINGKL